MCSRAPVSTRSSWSPEDRVCFPSQHLSFQSLPLRLPQLGAQAGHMGAQAHILKTRLSLPSPYVRLETSVCGREAKQVGTRPGGWERYRGDD